MPTKTIRVRDPEALSTALKEFTRSCGSQRAAADALGISPASYSKLVNQQRSQVEVDTVTRLLEALGGWGRLFAPSEGPIPFGRLEFSEAEIEAVCRSGAPDRETALHRLRSESQGEHSATHALWDAVRKAFVSDELQMVWDNWQSWLHGALSSLPPTGPATVRALWERADTGAVLRDFLEAVRRDPSELPGVDDHRCWLALRRAVAPLADDGPTWAVEPGVVDLRDRGDLIQFLKLRLSAEELLMRPPSDLERVIMGSPPMTYGNWLGPPDDV